jgi:hypothetical protein
MRLEIRQLGCSATHQTQPHVNMARISNKVIHPNYGFIHVAKLFPLRD